MRRGHHWGLSPRNALSVERNVGDLRLYVRSAVRSFLCTSNAVLLWCGAYGETEISLARMRSSTRLLTSRGPVRWVPKRGGAWESGKPSSQVTLNFYRALS